MRAFKFGEYTPFTDDEKAYLDAYDSNKWKKASHTADIAVFAVSGDALYLLLIKRGGVPYRGWYCLPGGFADMEESLDQTAARELSEETGIADLPLHQVVTYGETGRDPRDRCITTLYMTLAKKEDIKAKAGDDAADADFCMVCDYDKECIYSGSAKEEYVTLTLEGKNTFEPQIKRTFEGARKVSFEIPDHGGLAFDHARAVIDAYEFLKKGFYTGETVRSVLGESFSKNDLKKLFKTVFLRTMEEKDMLKADIRKNADGSYSFI